MTYRPIGRAFADAVSYIRRGGGDAEAAATAGTAQPSPDSAPGQEAQLKTVDGVALLRVHISDPWHGLVRSGAKRVEGRLNAGAFAQLVPGSRVVFHNETRGEFAAVVEGTRVYASFEEMLRAEGLERALPVGAVRSIEDGVAVYRRFYTEEDERAHGVLALQVRPLPQP